MTPDRFSDAFILEQAKGCETLSQLWRKLGWPDFQHVRRANERLNLNLPIIRKSSGAARLAKECPKPVGKGVKPKPKEGVE